MTPNDRSSLQQTANTIDLVSEGFPFHQRCSDAESESRFGASSLDLDNRFVAGTKFFNYEHLRALRKGGEISLFSRNQYGILAGAFTSCAVSAILRYIACVLHSQVVWAFILRSLHSAHMVFLACQHR